MKIRIDKDEWYPVYTETDREPGGLIVREVEVEEAFYERWQKALDEFESIQDTLNVIYHAHGEAE